jgi:hypothetical protein
MDMWKKWGKQGIHGELWWENHLKSNHIECIELDAKIILEWILGRLVVDKTDQESYLVSSFGTNDVEPSGSSINVC